MSTVRTSCCDNVCDVDGFIEVVVYDACDVDEVDVGGVKLKDLVRDVGVVDDVCHVDEDFVGDASDG